MARAVMQGSDKISPEVQAAISSLPIGQTVTVIVTLKDKADLTRIGGVNRASRLKKVINALRDKAAESQGGIKAILETRRGHGKVRNITSFWVFNGMAVTATSDVIQELAKYPEVQQITPDEISIVPVASLPFGAPEPNLSVINAPALWNMGFYGQDVVVANMDSGVDVNHPDLVTQWRGGTNSWFDPYGQHPDTPTDLSGHGTWTMGVMVGGDAGGTSLGVAPLAKWIAVKIFNDKGKVTATAIHQGFQWLLDPDGDPNTDDAPQVVNNSWAYSAPGCNLEFQYDLQALRAAGIVPVFAAGNYGPNNQTSVSPANYPEAFAVGATDNNGQIYFYSSRGPSACGGGVYPDVVAPGVDILTTERFGLYSSITGSSVAAPHVAGVMALLLSAFPSATVSDLEFAITQSALDLGPDGTDYSYGYGLIDAVYAHYYFCTDEDSDTYAIEGGSCGPVDCNDNDINVHPGAAESCNNIDDNCDGSIDEGLSRPTLCGVGACAASGIETCTAGVWSDDTCIPGTPSAEVCNYIDDNCDGPIDEGVATTYYQDNDDDTYGNASVTQETCSRPAGYVADSTDCNDTDASVYPGGPDVRIVAAGVPAGYYTSIQNAYINTPDGGLVQSRDAQFTENLHIDSAKTITFENGYDCAYDSMSGQTTVYGNMTVSNGAIIIQNGTMILQ